MAYTTMWQLMSDIKSLGLEYTNDTKGTTLKTVPTWKLGILSETSTVYPAIAILPVMEVHQGFRNGGIYKVDRLINIELFSKTYKLSDVGKHLQDISSSFIDTFYDDSYPNNWKMRVRDSESEDYNEDTVFFFDFGRIEYSTIQADNIFQRSIIPITFRSWEAAPTFVKTATITDTDVRLVGEYVYSMLGEASTLDNVKFIFSHIKPPFSVGRGIVVSVLENVDQRNKRETGRDNPTGLIEIRVWTKASPYEDNLKFNLDTVEKIKDVLQADQNLGGLCYRTQIEGVDYGIDVDTMLYETNIRFNTWSYNKIPIS